MRGERRCRELTVAEPVAKVADLALLDEARVEVLAELVDDRVHVGLHGQHGRGGVVADDGALHAGVLDALDLAEHVVLDSSVNHGAAVLVEVGLWTWRGSVRGHRQGTHCPGPTDLDPASIGAVDDLGDLGVVDVEEVGPDPDDGPVLLMELLDGRAIVGRVDLVFPPEVGPSWMVC